MRAQNTGNDVENATSCLGNRRKQITDKSLIDLFTDTAATLNSVVSYSYYGMLRGQISMYFPPEHPIIYI